MVILKRDVVDEIIKYLGTDNIIVLNGARQVGKTHILYWLQNYLQDQGLPTYFLDLEDSRLVEVLDKGVDSFLGYLKDAGLIPIKSGLDKEKKSYVFIDEIQYLEKPSPFLKLIADHHKYLQLVVSGSSSFNIRKKFSDSLVGRTVNFEIFNLSFREFLRFKNIDFKINSPMSDFYLEKTKEYYREYILYGGYPKVVMADGVEVKDRYLQQIVDTYLVKDIRDLGDIKDIKKFNGFLKILASQSGQLLSVAKLANITGFAKQTIDNYLSILENTYIIKLVPPFSGNPRVEVVKAPKIFFYDTGLSQVLWLNSLQKNILGNMLETSVFAELVKKFGRESVFFWRTQSQTEIDFILRTKERILPIEVKLSFQSAKKSALFSFRDKYKIKDYKIVGLEGEKTEPKHIYPWEI